MRKFALPIVAFLIIVSGALIMDQFGVWRASPILQGDAGARPVCGDGKYEPPYEHCEENKHCDKYRNEYCNSKCQCKIKNSKCGDKIWDEKKEECENNSQCDVGWKCKKCKCVIRTTKCGDGKVRGKEQCEPPGTSSCDAWCKKIKKPKKSKKSSSSKKKSTNNYNDDNFFDDDDDDDEKKDDKKKKEKKEKKEKKDKDDDELYDKSISLPNGGTAVVEKQTVITFVVDKEEHILLVNKVKKSTIEITVESDPQDFKIELKKTKKIDVTGDEEPDITVTLTKIKKSKATIKLVIIDKSECGDNILDPGEECEPPNSPLCDKNCKNKIIQSSPVEDPGELVSDSSTEPVADIEPSQSAPAPVPKPASPLPKCGDGIVNNNEQCESNAGCSPQQRCRDCMCVFYIPDILPVCGNFRIEKGEECDDGNELDGDGCNSWCFREKPAQVAAIQITSLPDRQAGEPEPEILNPKPEISPLLAPTPLPSEALAKEGTLAPTPAPAPEPTSPAKLEERSKEPEPKIASLPLKLPPIKPVPITATVPSMHVSTAPQPIIQRAPIGDTGPTAIALIASGSAFGYTISRRKIRGK
jgi:cysteine-rich repeat protein|tara:strand:- start:5884 stop:7635 length:1752 start_codon:yes stop_codon:yes gene_type:complete